MLVSDTVLLMAAAVALLGGWVRVMVSLYHGMKLT